MTDDEPIDLGHDHTLQFADWDPDLDLNPEYWDIADQFPARVSAIIRHALAGGHCEGAITFDTPIARRAVSDGPFWTVESWEPLTLSPSLLCHCGDHGYIRDGRWVPA